MYEENETLAVDTDEIEAAWQDDDAAGAADGHGEEREEPAAADQREQEKPSGQEHTDGQEHTEAEQGPADQPELFTLKNRDEVRQVTRDELVAMAQKGWDYDNVRQERDQLRQYRTEADPALALVKGYAQRNGMSLDQYVDAVRKQELLSQGLSESTAQAQLDLEKRQAALRAQSAQVEEARQRQEEIEQQARERAEARRRGMLDFLKSYPGVKAQDIPREVWARVAAGESLTSAYTLHRNRLLEAELAAERQNKQNRQTAAGSLAAAHEGDGKNEIDTWWYEDD